MRNAHKLANMHAKALNLSNNDLYGTVTPEKIQRYMNPVNTTHALRVSQERYRAMRNQYKNFAVSVNKKIKNIMKLLERTNYQNNRTNGNNPHVYSNNFNNALGTPKLKQSFKNKVHAKLGHNVKPVNARVKFNANLASYKALVNSGKTLGLITKYSNLVSRAEELGIETNIPKPPKLGVSAMFGHSPRPVNSRSKFNTNLASYKALINSGKTLGLITKYSNLVSRAEKLGIKTNIPKPPKPVIRK